MGAASRVESISLGCCLNCMGVIALPFIFARISARDLPLLHEWLNRPHVAERWDGPVEAVSMLPKFQSHMHSDTVFGYLAILDDAPVGYAQTYEAAKVGEGWWPSVAQGTWGIDQFLAEKASLGKGLGTRLVRDFAQYVFRRHSAERIITDPSLNNPMAIRCYEKAGFKPFGEIETPDGRALLMELGRDFC